MTRKLEVDLYDLLDLTLAAESYGYGDSIFFDAMGKWAGQVSDEEIKGFANQLTEEDEDEVESIVDQLTEWRNRYCNRRKKR